MPEKSKNEYIEELKKAIERIEKNGLRQNAKIPAKRLQEMKEEREKLRKALREL